MLCFIHVTHRKNNIVSVHIMLVFCLAGALLDARDEHARGKLAVPELRFSASADSEHIWAERKAIPVN